MRASSARITRSLRVQPNRHPAMRLATMHLLHFFFSFAAISVSSILVGIETSLHPHSEVTDQVSVRGGEPPVRSRKWLR